MAPLQRSSIASSHFSSQIQMDREQEELQFLGFFGICKESTKILTTWTKIFTKITLSLILPFSFIFLANIEISMIPASKIISNDESLDFIRPGTTRSNKISETISSEWTLYWLAKLLSIIFLLIFPLLSTSAVVYTVACIYTSKEITFRKVMSVVPKVWKRLFVTFLWSFAIVFIYNVVAVFIFVIWALLFYRGGNMRLFDLYFLTAIYWLGFVYVSVIWQLANVISVLEDIYGSRAMIKSKALIAGKMGVSVSIFLVWTFSSAGIKYLFEKFVVLDGERIGIVGKIGYGALSLLLLSLVFLVSLLVQTVIYFVCKSYHHENIDKSSLSDHLEVYLGEYVPLTAKDVQI